MTTLRWVLMACVLCWTPVAMAAAPATRLTQEEAAAVMFEATLDYENGDYEQGVAKLEMAADLAPDPVPLLTLMAEGYIELGEPNEAISLLRQALALNPACLKCSAKLGYVLAGVGEREKARVVLQQGLVHHPQDPILMEHLSMVDEGKPVALPQPLSPALEDRVKEAKRQVEELVNNFQVKTGEEWIMEKNYRRAVETLGWELEEDSANHEQWTNLGVAYDGLGDYTASAQAHQKALALEPDFDVAWNNLGHSQEMLGDFTAAEQSYRRALALSPSYSLAMQNLANTLLKLDKVDAAIAMNHEAIAADPTDPAPHNNLAFAYFKLGRCQSALAALDKAAALAPDEATVTENRTFIQEAVDAKNDVCLPEPPTVTAVSTRQPPALPPGMRRGFTGHFVAALAQGELIALTPQRFRPLHEGKLASARGGTTAWLTKVKQGGYIIQASRGEGRPVTVDKHAGLKKNLVLSPDGTKLAYEALDRTQGGSVVKVVSAETGQVLKSVPMRASSLSWRDDGTLLILSTGCGDPAYGGVCLQQLPLNGTVSTVDFGDTAKYLFYADGAPMSPTIKGVLYAASNIQGDALVRIDLNDHTVRLVRPASLRGNFTPVSDIAIREGVPAVALAVGSEVWLIREDQDHPDRFPLPGQIRTLSWVP